MEPVVLVHLSDIHFTAAESGLAARNASLRIDLTSDLKAMTQEVGRASAVIVTGDIAYSGSDDEYAIARSWLDEVAEIVGLDRSQILTVPGNHDVTWPAITPARRLARQHLRTCSGHELDGLLERYLGDATEPLIAPLKNYNEFALNYLCDVSQDGRPWKIVLPLPEDHRLAIHGLCTVFNSDGDDSDTSLVTGTSQVVLPRESTQTVNLLLAHHGPNNCRDRDALRDRLRTRAHLVLCGHKHAQRVSEIDGYVEVTAGAVHPEEQTGWDPTYNLLRLDVQHSSVGVSLEVDLYQRVWKPEWQGFRDGTGTGGCVRYTVPLASSSAAPTGAANTSRPASVTTAATPSDPGADPTATVQPEPAEERPVLRGADGEVPPVRQAVRALLDLSVTDQVFAMQAAGLLGPDDAAKSHIDLVMDAVARITDDATYDALMEAVQSILAKLRERTS